MINITPLNKTQKFIEKAKLIHGDRYDYSLVDYKGAQVKVKIICKEHGIYEQIPNSHLLGNKCKKCGKRKFKTNEKFIEESNLIHNDKYNYGSTKHIKAKLKVEILCDKHGMFSQYPTDHLRGVGCPKCAGLNLTTEDFIIKSEEVHGKKYDYSESNYVKSDIKIKINCLDHGYFFQLPNSHWGGQGCHKCFSSKGERFISSWLIKNNISFEEQKKFDGCRYKRVLPFDFYLPDYNAVIEFHGDQHYKSVKRFGGDEVFTILKLRDNIKKSYCLENDIEYIELNKNNINELQTIIGFYKGK